MKKLFLIGGMGAGKSTARKALTDEGLAWIEMCIRDRLVGRLVLVLHDEEVLVAIVGNVGAEGIQALELLHHVVGLRLADDGRPVLVPNMVGHMGQGLDLFVALDLSKCNACLLYTSRCV